ncbi:RNA methyltransferase [Serinicoccus chungangensis]|uniref:RNA methyltransferase n=1 Tax=Serinicoccus chungangensis TaxID=767452 RepID=A0A0W8IBS8_9MICO|nr:TfoX/Sxy family protein [Serinicoccus chungangensis]KUG57403.1 RNA methyltransferase [Serinicoccus chungangensis]
MGYDAGLAQRIRDLLADEPGVVEQRMFGGLAFLVAGHLAVAATGGEGVMVHVDEALADDLVRRDGLERMVMRGRPMREWVHADGSEGVADELLAELVALGVARARDLPPKP